MPSWPARVLNCSSPTIDHLPDVFSSHDESFHNYEERDLESLVVVSSYLSVTTSPSSSASFHPVRRPRRGRVSSPHFLQSLANNERKLTDDGITKTREGHANECDFSESRPRPAKTLTPSIRTMPSQQGNTGLMTGKCATCGSLVRWPRHLHVFRCTVCLMVNHLKSTSAKPTHEDGLRASLQIKMDETEAWNQKPGKQRPGTTFSLF